MGSSTRRVKELLDALTSTRRRRLLLVGAALLLGFFALNYGYFSRELAYQVSQIQPEESPIHAQEPDSTGQHPVTDLSPNEIRVASVDVRVPVVYVDVIDEATFQDALMGGVVHYPLTAAFGQPGNAYVFGHSSDLLWKRNPYANAFATLPHVKVGDIVEVTDPEGNVFTYVVTETFVVSPSDTRVLDQGDGTQSVLTLQTSYPVGTALARFIVRAELQVP